jgi:hypothetical protein
MKSVARFRPGFRITLCVGKTRAFDPCRLARRVKQFGG